MEADNDRLTTELHEFNDQVIKKAKFRQLSEAEVNRVKAVAQVLEADKQALLQKIQELTVAVEYLKGIIAKSVDDCFHRLKLELNATMGDSCY